MGWFDSFFQGLSDLVSGGGSSAPAQVDPFGGWDTAVQHAADGAGSSFDLSSVGTDWTSGLFDGAGGGGGVDSANPAMFDPNTVGPPPVPTMADSVGSVAPNQGSAVAGSFGGDSGGSFGGADAVDPETFARQGQSTNSWNPSTQSPVGSNVQAPPPPTAWESVQQAPGKWWQGVSDQFNRDPIGSSLKVGTGAAAIGLPIAAAAMAPGSPKAPRYSPIPAAPLPGTTGTGRADIPAGSPMSPMLAGGQGGFSVDPNKGLKKGGR